VKQQLNQPVAKIHDARSTPSMTHFDISTLNSAQVIKGRSKLPLTPYDYGNKLPIIKAEDEVKQAKKGVV